MAAKRQRAKIAAGTGFEGEAELRHPPGSGVFADCAWDGIAEGLGLSGRELELVRGVFDDRTDFAIAKGLGISPHTVHTHFQRLYVKLGVTNRVQLVLRVTNEFFALNMAPRCPWVSSCPLGLGSPAVL